MSNHHITLEHGQRHGNEISLYFHIPFCTKKCDYCHFFVLPDKDVYKTQLIEGLHRELDLWASHLQNKRLVSIYFGGGTPSLLGASLLAQILSKVGSIVPFNPNEIEITLEANPELLTQHLMEEYLQAGVNRVSIGIQSLDDRLLKVLGRLHESTTAIKAVEITSTAGIKNISIDLMYDIPGQTLQSWCHTLQQIKSLPITHLSLYNLTIEPHTVFFKYQEALRKQLPDADSSTAMYRTAIDTLADCSLAQYEISAFAKHDLFSRHNVGYWTARPFLGFGPSAFSYWEGRRFRNIANLNKYLKSLENDKLPVDFTEELTPIRRRKELLAIALRLKKGVDLTAFEQNYGPLDIDTRITMEQLQRNGWLEKDEDKNIIKLSETGMLFYDSVAVEII